MRFKTTQQSHILAHTSDFNFGRNGRPIRGFWLGRQTKFGHLKYAMNPILNQQPTYLYISLSFPSHSVSTRSSDSQVHVHSICPIITWQKGFLRSSVHASGIHTPWYPKLIFTTNIPFQTQNTPLQNVRSLPRLIPISLDCLPGFWFLLFSFYALSIDT